MKPAPHRWILLGVVLVSMAWLKACAPPTGARRMPVDRVASRRRPDTR